MQQKLTSWKQPARISEATPDCIVLLPCITTGAFSCVCMHYFCKLINKWVQLSTRFNVQLAGAETGGSFRLKAQQIWFPLHPEADFEERCQGGFKLLMLESLSELCTSINMLSPTRNIKETNTEMVWCCHGDMGIPDCVICFIQQLSFFASDPLTFWHINFSG